MASRASCARTAMIEGVLAPGCQAGPPAIAGMVRQAEDEATEVKLGSQTMQGLAEAASSWI